MQFYIDITGCTSCCTSSVRSLLRKYKYKFMPQNRKFYLVNVQQRTCVGVQSMTMELMAIKAASYSFKELGKKLGSNK